jgi:DNA-binding response OmpR family regulator
MLGLGDTDKTRYGRGALMDITGLRVMVFEDDFLLAGTLADVLDQLGCTVVRCIGAFDQAMEAARTVNCDFAVVDLQLRGIMGYPLLDCLEQRGIPRIIASCQSRAEIPARYMSMPAISKPYTARELRRAIDIAWGGKSAHGPAHDSQD